MADSKQPLAENIAFLSLFANQGRALTDPVLELLPSNNTQMREDAKTGRLLTFGEERRLAEVFAFILATTEKPSQVGAFCIEEQPNSSGFIVRFATNSATLEALVAKEVIFQKIIKAARCGTRPGVFDRIHTHID